MEINKNVQISTLCYIRKNNQTLMLHRIKKDKDIHQGKWNGLGGKLEQGEMPEDCVIREVKEESGLIIKEPQMRGVMSFPLFKDNQDWMVFLFTVDNFEGKIIECLEGELKWIDDTEILNLNLWEGDKYFIKWLKETQFFSAQIYL